MWTGRRGEGCGMRGREGGSLALLCICAMFVSCAHMPWLWLWLLVLWLVGLLLLAPLVGSPSLLGGGLARWMLLCWHLWSLVCCVGGLDILVNVGSVGLYSLAGGKKISPRKQKARSNIIYIM